MDPVTFTVILSTLGAALGVVGSIMSAMTGALKSVVNALSQSAISSDKLNTAISRLGTSIPSLEKALGGQIGKLAGRNQELLNAIDILDSSLPVTNAALNKLTLENKLSGINNKNLLKTIRQSISVGTLNNKNLTGFVEGIGQLRDSYQISTDTLTAAMAKFSSDLDLAFYGVGKQFSEAAMKLEGKFGEGTAGLFDSLQKQLLSSEMFGRRLQFGIQGLTESLMNPAISAEALEQNTLSIVKILGKQIKELEKSYKSMGLSPDVILSTLGEYFGSKELVTTVRALEKSLSTQKELIDTDAPKSPFELIAVAFEKIKAPFQELGFNFGPVMIKAVNYLRVFVNKLKDSGFFEIVKKFFYDLGNVIDIFTIRLAKLDFSPAMMAGIKRFFDGIINLTTKIFILIEMAATDFDTISNSVVSLMGAIVDMVNKIFQNTITAWTVIEKVQNHYTRVKELYEGLYSYIFDSEEERMRNQLSKKLEEDAKQAQKAFRANKFNNLNFESQLELALNGISSSTNANTAALERDRADKKRELALAEARDALNYQTNSYLALQSQSLNRTMQEIIYGKDLQQKILEEQRKANDILDGIKGLTAIKSKSAIPIPN